MIDRERERKEDREIVPEDGDASLDNTVSVFNLQLQSGSVTASDFPAKYLDQKL